VDFGLALREAVTEPATLVWNEAPHGPFGYSRFGVLAEPSMSWWTMRWPASGALLPGAKLHSHFARHHRLFLVDEAPQQLAFFGSHVKSIVHVHESVPPTSGHETMLLANLSYTEQTLSRMPSIICRDDDSMPSFIVAAAEGHPNGSRWARRRDFLCTSHNVLKGRINTFVQLYKTVAEAGLNPYPMHTNTWFYIQEPGAESSADIKAVSYRYATFRTRRLLEPLQDEAFGSCEDEPSAAAVADYVDNNAAGLTKAVAAHHAVGAAAITSSSTASPIDDTEGRGIRVLSLTAAVPCLFLAVVLLRERAARARAKALH